MCTRSVALLVFAAAGCSRSLDVPPLRPLKIDPASASVAPGQRLSFAASGGSGGYTFSFSAPGAQSGTGASVDPQTGAYRAGDAGSAVDQIEVSDGGGQVVVGRVTVGPRLVLDATRSGTAPGGRITLSATGGLPPYVFAFAAHGNRSGGTVDRSSGLYQAGENVGALDVIEVTDAVGASARLPAPIAVGPRELGVPGGASRIEIADLDGDGRPDLLLLGPPGGFARDLIAVRLPRRVPPQSSTYSTPGSTLDLGATDLEGTGREEVLVAGPSSLILRGSSSGALVDGPAIGAYGTHAAGPFVAQPPGFCHVARVAWNAGAPLLTCMPEATPGPPARGPLVGLASGDYSASGVDCAWLEGLAPPTTTNAPGVHFTETSGTAAVYLAPPAGATIDIATPEVGDRRIATVPGTGSDGAAVLLGSGGRNLVGYVPPFTVATSPAWASWPPVDPFPGGSPALGLAACASPGAGQPPAVVAWNGGGTLGLVTVDAASLSTLDVGLIPVEVVACADLDGDGVPDLVAAGSSSGTATVLLGDGDGGFGRRPRFAVGSVFALGDVDGDGIADVVTATEAPGLQVLFGDEHQLARGPETQLGIPTDRLAVGNFGGGSAPRSGDVVFQGLVGGLYLSPSKPDGSYGVPTTLRPPDPASPSNRLDALAAAELGGTAAGLDVVGWTIEHLPAVSLGRGAMDVVHLVAVVRDGVGPRVLETSVEGGAAAAQPVDLSGGGVPDAVAVAYETVAMTPIPPTAAVEFWRPGALGWSRIASVPVAGLGGPGFIAVGAAPGVAVFRRGTTLVLASTASASVLPSPAPDATSLALGWLEPGQALPGLVAAGGAGGPAIFRGTPGAGGALAGFTPGPAISPAPGSVAAIAAQGSAAPADVLFHAADALVPIAFDAATGAWR